MCNPSPDNNYCREVMDVCPSRRYYSTCRTRFNCVGSIFNVDLQSMLKYILESTAGASGAAAAEEGGQQSLDESRDNFRHYLLAPLPAGVNRSDAQETRDEHLQSGSEAMVIFHAAQFGCAENWAFGRSQWLQRMNPGCLPGVPAYSKMFEEILTAAEVEQTSKGEITRDAFRKEANELRDVVYGSLKEMLVCTCKGNWDCALQQASVRVCFLPDLRIISRFVYTVLYTVLYITVVGLAARIFELGWRVPP